MTNHQKNFVWLALPLDVFLITVAFLAVNYIKRGTFPLNDMYLKLLLTNYLIVLMASFYFRKFHLRSYRSYVHALLTFLKSAVVSGYLVALLIVFKEFTAFSRVQLAGYFLLLVFLEASVYAVYHWKVGNRKLVNRARGTWNLRRLVNISLFRLLNEFLLITSSFFLINYLRRGTFVLTAEYERILLVLYGVWFVTSLFTRKFEFPRYQNFFYFLSPYLKSIFLMMALMATIIFGLRLFYYSQLQIFGTLVLLFIFETIYNALYFLDFKVQGNGASMNYHQLRKLSNGHTRPNGQGNPVSKVTRAGISETAPHLLVSQELSDFLSASIDLSHLDSDEIYHLNAPFYGGLNGRSTKVKVLINFHRVNDIRRINKYFLGVHNKLKRDAYLVGKFEPLETYRKKFFERYPRTIAYPLYWFDFLLVRVLPKLPHLNKYYFMLTKGKNRVVSSAEVLGRLHYCGFRVIDTKEISSEVYFVAEKIESRRNGQTPSYGPLIRIKRIGLGGRMIHIRKLRTMHPYSEYLQEYLYTHNNLESNGKFKNDFRISRYGKIFRQLWIDEIPQLINFFRGDLSLVGVRALSTQYFSLYPEELQKLRVRFKPGIIPPYYADLPTSFDEILVSEKRYLQQKQSNPFVTDFKYFSKAMYNIIFGKARSS